MIGMENCDGELRFSGDKPLTAISLSFKIVVGPIPFETLSRSLSRSESFLVSCELSFPMPPRTAARFKKKITTPPTDKTTSQAEASTSRPQKKQKSDATTTPNTCSAQPAKYAGVKGRKKGKLAFIMTEMPMEISFEIFAQLEPVDLLHLSRASKGLRSILIASNANILWKLVYYASAYFVSKLT
jgi:hypothetical protein